jgi:hypothetical protein
MTIIRHITIFMKQCGSSETKPIQVLLSTVSTVGTFGIKIIFLLINANRDHFDRGGGIVVAGGSIGDFFYKFHVFGHLENRLKNHFKT